MSIIEGIILFFVGSIFVVLILSVLEFVQSGIVVGSLFVGDWIGQRIFSTRIQPNAKLVTIGISSLVLVKVCVAVFGFAATITFIFDQRIWLDGVRDWAALLSWLFLIPLAISAFAVGLRSGKENIFKHVD